LLPAVAQKGAPSALRHYLWGGAPGIAERVAERLSEIAPTVQVVGCESPPYSDIDDEAVHELANRIRHANANVVWLGLGTPRQDYLVPRLSPLVAGPVIPVGAAFDFLSGRIAEAPARLHGTGLEWLHRLYSDPKRLWRRYLLGNPRFLVSSMRHRVRATWS
jgi:N-acetylglucosaminyldiphosphoundecaprenol N-acetyl-beta-D-mannosaminyltransferase